MLRIGPFASEFLKGDTTASDMTHSRLKTIPMAHEVVFLDAIVVAKHLFVQVAEQVEQLNVCVGALEHTLERAVSGKLLPLVSVACALF